MRGYTRFLLTLSAAIVLVLGGCNENAQEPAAPETGNAPLTLQKGDNPGLQHAMEVAQRNTERFLAREGVVGIGAGRAEDGTPAVVIYTEHALGRPAIPADVDGVPVTEVVTGKIFAQQVKPVKKPSNPGGSGGGGKSKPSFDPRAQHDPIYIGVSTGFRSTQICMAGTIGFSLTVGSTQYAVSNNHVFADENSLSTGAIMVQPGMLDAGCGQSVAFASLSGFAPITFSTQASNTADVAWAAVGSARTLLDGTPASNAGGYGRPSATPLSAAMSTATLANLIDVPVQKLGRTTGLTKGVVTGVGTFNIGYSNGTARFVNQLVIQAQKGRGFSDAGDSGSLIVTDNGNANPVGLLFAGNSRITLANPMGAVLGAIGSAFNTTISTIDGK